MYINKLEVLRGCLINIVENLCLNEFTEMNVARI